MGLPEDTQIAMEKGMMIAEVNMAIGAIDRTLKMTRNGKSRADECESRIGPLEDAPAEDGPLGQNHTWQRIATRRYDPQAASDLMKLRASSTIGDSTS
jgi:hypothetical protein